MVLGAQAEEYVEEHSRKNFSSNPATKRVKNTKFLAYLEESTFLSPFPGSGAPEEAWKKYSFELRQSFLFGEIIFLIIYFCQRLEILLRFS